MSRLQNARERARAEVTAEILAEARRQLAVDGPAGLSVRSVARELGLVSSAIYRYVESRDDLLTRLIIEAYDALGEVAEGAAANSVGSAPAERFVAVAVALRGWALAHPHEYALVHGSPVPGYAAPSDTIGPASRVPRVLMQILADAAVSAPLRPPGRESTPAVPPTVRSDAERIVAELLADATLPPDVVVRLVAAWTQMYGFISFELFGQTRGVVSDHDGMYDLTVRSMAFLIGLPSAA